MSKHTVGPWHIGAHGGMIWAANKQVIAYMMNVYVDSSEIVGKKECRANERLIASAPELLKALETIASIKRSDGAYDVNEMKLDTAIVIAQRAIDEVKEACDDD